MHTLQQPQRALVTLVLLLSMTFVAMIAIRQARGLVDVFAMLIQCTILTGIGVVLIYGAIVPTILAMLGARSAA